MAGRPKQVTARLDDLSVVWMLKRLGWSARRIGTLFSRHHSTISAWYRTACEMPDEILSAIHPEGERRTQITYVGNTTQLETLAGCLSHSNEDPDGFADEEVDE